MRGFILKSDWNPVDDVKITDEQLAVIHKVDKNIAIIAGPGTGKTEVLAQKATYLLQTGICHPPFRILTLCYKIDAASNIRDRVKKRCPQDLANRFQSMTVDSFLIFLVRRFATSLPEWLKIKRDFEIIDNIDETKYNSHSNVQLFPKTYRTELNVLANNMSNETKDLYIYAANNNEFDYKMCHTMAYYIVKNNPNVRELFSKTYKYIFLDEFQDMTDRHYDTIKLLFCNDYNKISAVGDYNQAIMGWAGAIPDIFKTFKDDFMAENISFTYNHRSSPQIVTFINKVVKPLTPSHFTPIQYQSNKTSDSTSFISAKHFHSVTEEATYVAQCINKIKAENTELKFGDFAIILKQKTSDYLAETEKVFEDNKTSVRNEDANVCKGGLKYQDLVVDSLSKLNIYLIKAKLKVISILELKELHFLLSIILSLDLDRQRDIRKLHDAKRKIIKHEGIDIKTWMDNIFTVLSKDKVYKKLYDNKTDFDKAITSILELLPKCIETAKDDLPIAIDEYMGVNSVRLMTTHKSKGLEFDTVFFADFNPQSWWVMNPSKPKETEEALRCFFVGLSRAKKRLFFTNPTDAWPEDIDNILKESNMITEYNP